MVINMPRKFGKSSFVERFSLRKWRNSGFCWSIKKKKKIAVLQYLCHPMFTRCADSTKKLTYGSFDQR